MSDDETIWGVSNGGLFSFRDGEFDKLLTPVDGMHRLDGITVAYIQKINSVVIGYRDGMIDLYTIDDEKFERIEDIFRVQSFTAKQVNDFEIYNENLFVATQFGIVVYDINTFLVSNSYTKIGGFNRGSPVIDITIVNDTTYLGTQEGVAIADVRANLDIESSWTNYSQGDGLASGTVQSVSFFNGDVLASTNSSNFILRDDNWENYPVLSAYSNLFYKNVTADGRLVLNTQDRVLILDQNDNLDSITPGITGITDVIYDSGNSSQLFISTITSGLGLSSIDLNDFEYFAPRGPNFNFFEGMSFDHGTFISGTTRLSQRNSVIDNRKGYYIRDETGWRNFNRDTSDELNQAQFRQAFTTAFNDEYYYIGSWGRGIARHNRDTDEINVYNSSNSTLRGWAADDSNFPVISGLETDEQGAVWATSRYATDPLYVQLPGEDEWINYGKSAAVSPNDEYFYLFVDSFNQKWITLQTAGGAGRGVLVLDTGDPTATNESTGVKLTEELGNGNLPDITVTSIIEDKEGEVWIGTERGIARFIFPQFVITGSQEERRAQWLINEDPDAASPFLLRDISVTAMAVNAANQKWIGTAAEGIWLLNETGSAILKRFTAANSPLFSDAIRDISVNDVTGEVYISTDSGLSVYQDVPLAASSLMDVLKVYPNPFLYEKHSSISIENLTEITTIRILGVDGTLIRTIENRGGRALWDGRDSQGRELGSGVYIVVALGPDGDQRGIGKVAIIK
jgi:ligand-binding sensor domain-containing protein